MSQAGWELRVAASAERQLARLPERIAAAVVEFIVGPLCGSPRRVGHPLQRDLARWAVARAWHPCHQGLMCSIGACLVSTTTEPRSPARRRDLSRWPSAGHRRSRHRVRSTVLRPFARPSSAPGPRASVIPGRPGRCTAASPDRCSTSRPSGPGASIECSIPKDPDRWWPIGAAAVVVARHHGHTRPRASKRRRGAKMRPCLDQPSPVWSVSGCGLVARALALAASSSALNARLTPSSSFRPKTKSGARLARRAGPTTSPTGRRIPIPAPEHSDTCTAAAAGSASHWQLCVVKLYRDLAVLLLRGLLGNTQHGADL